eukprot:gene14494-20518_t
MPAPDEYLSLFPEDDEGTWGQHWRATQLAYDMLLPNSKNFTTANQILTLEEALGDLAANITREDLISPASAQVQSIAEALTDSLHAASL